MENYIFYKFLVWIEDFNLFHVILTLYLKKKVKFQKKRHLFWENKKQIQIIEICCMPEIRKFGHISDFLSFYLSSKNSHQLGLNPPTDMQGRAKLHFLMPKSNQTIVKDFNFLQTIQIICKSDKIQVDNIKQ